MRGPQGPVVRHLSVVAERVKVRARQLVGVSKGPGFGTQMVRGKEAHLRDTIIVRPVLNDSRGPAFLIGSDHPIAELHAKGTRPHVILPRNARALRFTVAGGDVVFAKRVNHPGTRANPYLEQALEEVVRRS